MRNKLLSSLIALFAASALFAQRPSHPNGSRVFIPVVVHASGIQSADFRSDVFLLNRGATPANVNLIFTPSAADGRTNYVAKAQVLAAGETVALRDIVAELFERSGGGSLEINSDSQSIVARSTTYNVRPFGNVGQSVIAATNDDAIGLDDDPLYLMPVERTEQWRTNIGFSEVSGHAGRVKITFASPIAAINSAEYDIQPYSHVQIPVLAADALFGINSASVRVISGDARIVPYASVVEQQSGDPSYVTGRKPVPSAHEVIPVAAYLRDSGWKTELWYSNVLWAWTFDDDFALIDFPPIPGPPPTLTFYPAHNPAESRTYNDLGIASYINDAVFSYFEFFDGAFGQIDVPPSDGSLLATRLSAPAKSGSRFANGTVGQTIEPVPVTRAIGLGQSVEAIGTTINPIWRTNVGVSEISGANARVKLELLDAAGNLLGTKEIDVAAHGVVQFSMGEIKNEEIQLGRVRFTVTGGTGKVLAYASIVDRASSDPTFILAE